MELAPRSRIRLLWLVAGVLGVALLLETYALHRANRYNAAVGREDWSAASRHAGDHGRLANALMLQHSGDWQKALEIYGEFEQDDDRPLAQIARYNMANIYLRQGMKQTAEGSMDVALPLIELAKSAYRAVLRADPGDWEARFNLAAALKILPDVELEAVEEDIMPERSRRSLVPLDARRELP